MRGLTAFVLCAVVVGAYAIKHGATIDAGDQIPGIGAITRQLQDTASDMPRWNPGIPDLDWCLTQDRVFGEHGFDISGDSLCQGQTMDHWRSQKGQPS